MVCRRLGQLEDLELANGVAMICLGIQREQPDMVFRQGSIDLGETLLLGYRS